MATAFGPDDQPASAGVTDEARVRALRWTPPGFLPAAAPATPSATSTADAIPDWMNGLRHPANGPPNRAAHPRQRPARRRRSLGVHGPLRPPPPAAAEQIFSAAQALLPRLETGRPMDRKAVPGRHDRGLRRHRRIRNLVLEAKPTTPAEIALTLFLQRYGPAMLSKAGSPDRMLGLIEKLTTLEPAQTRRDDVQQR